MDRRDLTLYSKETIASTTSKGNQEKWYDRESDRWYKADAFGYEALAEAAASIVLRQYSNVVSELGIPVVEYNIEQATLHGRPHIVCTSKNFLHAGESIVTVHRLLSVAMPDYQERMRKAKTLPNKIRLLADAVEDITGLDEFAQYLTLLFEVDALILNTDRHLNNIAVLRSGDKFRYCPIFDNGGAFLFAENGGSFNIETAALIKTAEAMPFRTTFPRLVGTARRLYGPQLRVSYEDKDIEEILPALVKWYPAPLQGLLADRVKTVLIKQKKRYFQENSLKGK